MIEVDQSQWPIVFMTLDGLTSVSAMQEYIDEFEKLLQHSRQQNEQFGLIYLSLLTDEEHKAAQRSTAANQLSSIWLKKAKAEIGTRCVGIAMVTKAKAMMQKMKPVIKQSLEQGMGAPGDIFLTQPEAVAWITQQLPTT